MAGITRSSLKMKTVLVVAYLSMFGESSITVTEMLSWKECNVQAKAVYNKVKVGRARAWCQRIVDGGRYERLY